MIYSIYPVKDATIYKLSGSMNTGVDEILEIQKTVNGTSTASSRVLMKFNLKDIQADVNAKRIPGTAKFYLNMSAVDAREIQAEYTLYAYPVSQSWDMGLGRAKNSPQTTDGVSWNYRYGTTNWISGSLTQGGTYFTSSVASQSFDYELADIRMDVSNIVWNWLSGSIPNEGFMIKYSSADEQSNRKFGNIQYYSLESHTIYVPKLEIAWDDSTFITGSLTALTSDNISIYTRNVRDTYQIGTRTKIRVFGRQKYPPRNFSTQSAYLDVKYLPRTTYYAVQDTVTSEYIIPFDDIATKLSCDVKGNYFNLWLDAFQPERYYKIVFRVDRDDTSEYYDENVYFKVVR